MTTLLCLAAAGIIMGISFNGYALMAVCLVVVIGNVLTAAHVGFGHAVIESIFGIALLQLGYWVALIASTFLFPSRSTATPRLKNDGPAL